MQTRQNKRNNFFDTLGIVATFLITNHINMDDKARSEVIRQRLNAKLASRTVSTSTADNFVRHLHSFKYTFLKETDGDNYPRFALYTLGGDNYNYVQFPTFAYGMGEESVLDNVPIKDVIEGVSDFHYTDYYQVDAPNGCSSGGVDASSCWFAMLTDPSQNIHQRGHRGIVVRNFHGQLDGKPWPPTEGDASPFTFNLIKSRQNNAAQNTAR